MKITRRKGTNHSLTSLIRSFSNKNEEEAIDPGSFPTHQLIKNIRRHPMGMRNRVLIALEQGAENVFNYPLMRGGVLSFDDRQAILRALYSAQPDFNLEHLKMLLTCLWLQENNFPQECACGEAYSNTEGGVIGRNTALGKWILAHLTMRTIFDLAAWASSTEFTALAEKLRRNASVGGQNSLTVKCGVLTASKLLSIAPINEDKCAYWRTVDDFYERTWGYFPLSDADCTSMLAWAARKVSTARNTFRSVITTDNYQRKMIVRRPEPRLIPLVEV